MKNTLDDRNVRAQSGGPLDKMRQLQKRNGYSCIFFELALFRWHTLVNAITSAEVIYRLGIRVRDANVRFLLS